MKRWFVAFVSCLVSLTVGASPGLALSLYAVIPQEGTLAGQLWLVDPVNGNQLIGRPTMQGLEGLAADSNGTLWATTFSVSSGSSLLQIDPDDGSLLSSIPVVDSLGSPFRVLDLAIQPGTGVLYASTINADGMTARLFTIDKTTGITSLVGNTGFLTAGEAALGFAPDGTLYFTDVALFEETLFLYRLDPATGGQIGARIAYNGGNGSLAVDADGLVYGSSPICCSGVIRRSEPSVANSAALYANLVGVNAIGDLAFLPEPGSFVLLTLVLPLLWARRRLGR